MIGEICNKNVHMISPLATVAEAAKKMRDEHVGDLFITETKSKPSRPLGVITDRDIVTKVLAAKKAVDTPVTGVMSRILVTAKDTDGLQETILKMRDQGVRRIAVVDHKDQLCGVIAADDVYNLLSKELSEVAGISRKQIDLEKQSKSIQL